MGAPWGRFELPSHSKGLDNLLFMWGPTLGAGMNPSNTQNYWPGDNYVDIIGLSNYRGTTWDTGDQTDLDSYIAFAGTHSKPIAFAEGYANGIDEPDGLDHATVLGWIEDNPEIAYFMFWSGNKAPYDDPNPSTLWNDSLIYHRPAN